MRGLFATLAAAVLCVAARAEEPGQGEAVARTVKEAVAVLEKHGLSIDPAAAGSAAIAAVARTADPLSRLLTAEDAEAIKAQQRGLFNEVGIRIRVADGTATVAAILADTPAAEADLAVGDVVEEIDKGPVSGMNAGGIQELLRGPADQPVLLKVRTSNAEPRQVEVGRSTVEAGAVQVAEDLSPALGYVKLNGLFNRSGKDAVSALRGVAAAGQAGLVLDLRGAGGRDLDSVVDVASLFGKPGSTLFTFQDAQGEDLRAYSAVAATPLGIPVMVLIDDGTQGAAEVLAAVLQGSTRGAMLIGAATRGDPVVREAVDLPSGGQLYLATRKLLVANGKVYDGREGVQPDLDMKGVAFGGSGYEAEPDPAAKPEVVEEDAEARRLRDRVRGDDALQRAADVLMGLKALDIRGSGKTDHPAR